MRVRALEALGRERLAVAALAAGAWSVWTHRIGISDLDDAASNEVLFAREPLATILFDLKWADQSPLYFVVLHFWRAFGESPAWIKSLNLIAVTLAVVLLYEVARLVADSRPVALGAVALAVLSPAMLWVVRNGRMYSLQLLLFVACMYGLLDYARRRRRRGLALFVVAALLSIYNHFVGFAAVGTALLWLALEERAHAATPAGQAEGGPSTLRWLRVPVATGLAILLLVLPQVWRAVHLLGEAPRLIAGWSLPPSRVGFLDHLTWFWFVNSDWGGLRDWGPALRPVYLISASLLFVAGLSDPTGRVTRAGLATVVLPVVAGYLAAIGHADLRHRYFVHLLPMIWIVVASGALAGGGAAATGPSRAWTRGRRAMLVVVGLGSG
ncbi:MAG TPA: glycosyltransferase family 39 protein, partial [Vicinamibacteria bacterium]|nr:glycosyltransferase family 39 protein [Vicinamibacteria bacterium]